MFPYGEHTFYLSGPMTGLPDYNYPEFERISRLLREDEYTVLSPHETEPHPPEMYLEEDKWHYYMERAREMVSASTAILLMRGWPYSSGATQELKWSIEFKHDVFYFYDGHPYTIFPMTLGGHRESASFTV